MEAPGWISFFQALLLSVLIQIRSSQTLHPDHRLQILTHQFFQYELHRNTYFDQYTLDPEEQIVFHPSQVASPGLPQWLHFAQARSVLPGYLYGTPSDTGIYDMEIFGENLDSFETSRVLLQITVSHSSSETFPQHHVSLPIQDHDIDDLLNVTSQAALIAGLGPLWGQGAPLTIYGLNSAAPPLAPSSSEAITGVQVTLSSTVAPNRNFQLQAERVDCEGGNPNPVPSWASGLQRTFEVGWCGVTFATITNRTIVDPTKLPVYLGGEFIAPVRRMEESSDFAGFLLVVVLPAAILLAIVTTLCCMMFLNRQGIERRNYAASGVQLAHHRMIRQASQELRNLSNRRDGGPTPIGTPQQVATPNLRGRRTPTRSVLPHQTPPPPYRLPPDARDQQETSFSNRKEKRRSSEPSQSKGR